MSFRMRLAFVTLFNNLNFASSYYLKYDATEGVMYQVSKDGSTETRLVTNNELVYGWGWRGIITYWVKFTEN